MATEAESSNSVLDALGIESPNGNNDAVKEPAAAPETSGTHKVCVQCGSSVTFPTFRPLPLGSGFALLPIAVIVIVQFIRYAKLDATSRELCGDFLSFAIGDVNSYVQIAFILLCAVVARGFKAKYCPNEVDCPVCGGKRKLIGVETPFGKKTLAEARQYADSSDEPQNT